VVRRRDQHQRLRIRARQNQRCGRGVGRIRFDQDNAGVHAAGIKLLGHQKSEVPDPPHSNKGLMVMDLKVFPRDPAKAS